MTRKNRKIKPDRELGIYVHIPFCRSKCAYCDFYSLPCAGIEKERGKQMRRYADSVLLQLEDMSDRTASHLVSSIFFGGGTPTVMNTALLGDILDTVYENYKVADSAEITIEANPATVDLKALKKLLKFGFNRLSLGLQSANQNELASLSRIHTYDEFVSTYNDAREAGFENINVDLMYGIPEQTKASLRNTLELVTGLDPEHISLYGLKIEDGTPFAKNIERLVLPDEDTECDMYLDSIDFLSEKGYFQYEISNFAKPGSECAHNLKYWNCVDYLGFGCAAHSYFDGKRFAMPRDIDQYMEALESKGGTDSAVTDEQEISPAESVSEYVMLKLRTNEGVDTAVFYRRFGLDFEAMYEKYLPIYVDNGFMEHRDGRYSFTPKGMYVSNYILSAMLDFEKLPASKFTSAVDS